MKEVNILFQTDYHILLKFDEPFWDLQNDDLSWIYYKEDSVGIDLSRGTIDQRTLSQAPQRTVSAHNRVYGMGFYTEKPTLGKITLNSVRLGALQFDGLIAWSVY